MFFVRDSTYCFCWYCCFKSGRGGAGGEAGCKVSRHPIRACRVGQASRAGRCATGSLQCSPDAADVQVVLRVSPHLLESGRFGFHAHGFGRGEVPGAVKFSDRSGMFVQSEALRTHLTKPCHRSLSIFLASSTSGNFWSDAMSFSSSWRAWALSPDLAKATA
jgi:hypothetical protein